MIVGIGISEDWIDRSIGFVTKPLSASRSKTLNHATIEALREGAGDIAGLVIPQTIARTDFNFRELICHIRVDTDERLARTPILVVANDAEKYFEFVDYDGEIDELFYESIAVVVTDDPGPDALKRSVDENRLAAFRHQAGLKPFYDQGRHDRANAWGAFTVLQFLSIAKPGLVDRSELEGLVARLSEDVYYKIRIRELAGQLPSEHLVEEFRSQRGKLLAKIKNDASILIVEDQLEDGWRQAYEALLGSSAGGARLLFAEDETAARELFSSDLKLALLDVRLAQDRAQEDQHEADQLVDELAGVRLARAFREEGPAVPLIAATASNKSWTLNALLDRGINAYWVKEPPGLVRQADHAASNVIDLHRKLNSTLDWSRRTRGCIEAAYGLGNTVGKSDFQIGNRMHTKARSLHALLHWAPSPFAQELAEGLQLNLAFLLLFSFMNDLVTWACETETNPETGQTTWYLNFRGRRAPMVVRRRKTGSDEDDWVFDLILADPDRPNKTDFRDFPDSSAAIELLFRLGLKTEAFSFMELRAIRNGLPLTHGKSGGLGTTSTTVQRVSDEQLAGMIRILQAVVRAYTEG